jgi:bacillolysin
MMETIFSRRKILGRAVLFFAATAMALLLVGGLASRSTEAQSQIDSRSPNATPEEAQLLRQLHDHGAHVYRNSETGKVGLVGATPNNAIDRPPGLAADAPPEVAARVHMAKLGELFGIEDQTQELRVEETEEAEGGRSIVSFQQVHKGVPVLAGELNVQVDDANELLVANGEVLPDVSLDVEPGVSSQEARQTAIDKVAKDYGVDAGNLQATEPELWIYDPALLGGPGPRVPKLVWRMEVTNEGLVEIRELVLVDAEEAGSVALNFSQIAHGMARYVCDRNNVMNSNLNCLSFKDNYVRTEGQAATGISDVDRAYDHMGDFHNFYKSRFGRDSIDGAGLALRATVRVCDPNYPYPNYPDHPCPMPNGWWNGKQVILGSGMVSDDWLGHELTHGVTERESGLFYYYQSGAINESLSDIFGEFIDLTNGRGNDSASVRWLVFEDGSKLQDGAVGGTARNMKDPTALGDPDRMRSPLYYAGADLTNWDGTDDKDNGGVHGNSGVGNKAAYLITDGGTFNGRTVTGLGITKAAKIYYEVQTKLLTSGSDYQNLYAALPQACTNLIGTAGITSANCQEVKDAVNATEMNLQPTTAPAPEAPVCATGQTPTNLFFDNMENWQSGNWFYQTNVGQTLWDYDPTFATSGLLSMWGWDIGARSDSSVAKQYTVRLPSGKTTYLHFKHAYGFEDDNAGVYYDGGVLEYTTDLGATWSDLGSKFTHNGYKGTMSSSYSNPLGGRRGFVGESNGYISSRADLSFLAGKDVSFRFRIGTDSSVGDDGWFVDDVRVYTCA